MNKKNGKLKILFHLPNPDTVYAGRTIYYGYKHAFEDLGYEFRTLTPDSNQIQLLEQYKPDILMTSMGSLIFKFLDLNLVKKQKKQGMKVFINTPSWKSPMSKLRINEVPGISGNKDYVELIKSGNFGDVYYNVCEQGDPRMEGFEKITGYRPYTILLAADKTVLEKSKLNKKFISDISFIGTNLPEKRKYLEENIFPLKENYNLKLYGQDWTTVDKMFGWIQRGGQYFNVPYLRSIQKPRLSLEDEGNIYASSIISINVHEDYQRKFGGDCNERTFKIPIAGGFEITDNVACIRKYFKEGEEMVIAKNKKDWYDKSVFYMKNPEARSSIIEAGRKRVLKDHTYHNRVTELLALYEGLK